MRLAASVVLLAGVSALALTAAGSAQSGAEQSYDAENLRLERVVGLLDVRTGGVDRVTVEYDAGDGLVDEPRFEVRGDTLEITQLRRRDHVSCRSRGRNLQLSVERSDYEDLADYGRFVIRIPAGARVEVVGGAINGAIGDVGELELGVNSCGDITVGDVAGDASIAVNGSGDVRVGDVGGELDTAVNGSGDVEIGVVGGGLDAAINGSGDVQIAAVNGDIDAAIRGSGDVSIAGGQVRSMEVAIMGSGELRFEGVAENVSLAAMGSGDVYVAEVTGDVRSSAFGSGRVHVGRD
jgi:hypothetical protein